MTLQPVAFEHNRKTTLAGLREALSISPPKPPALTFAEYLGLDPVDRELYDQIREDYVRLGLRVETDEQTRCAQILRRLIMSNPRRPNSRRGLMISAPMFYGKTELAMLLARSVEKRHATRRPDYIRNGEAPVVWLEMTEHSTGKAVLAQIVEFLCPTIEIHRNLTTDRLRKMAVDLLQAHRTQLLVIDEAHKLGGSEPSSIIKALQNESSATVLLVGIDLLGGRAFGSGEASQVTMRCDLVELSKIDIKTEEGLARWLSWVTTFDRNLPLCDHARGILRTNARALHKVSGGQLAVLALIVERLVASILDDPDRQDERIDRARLMAVLDDLRASTPIRHRVTIDDLHELQ